jgi:hypothetical protein
LAKAAARESVAAAKESSRASESTSAFIRRLARTSGLNRSMYSKPRDAYRAVRYLTEGDRKGEKGAKGAFAKGGGDVGGSGGEVALAVGARVRDDCDKYVENT